MQRVERAPGVKIQIVIRRPPAEVFSAFVEPDKLTQFWLASASAPLAPGSRVRWDFMVRGATAETKVVAFEPPAYLAIEWDDGTFVEWRFADHAGEGTLVTLNQSGFSGSADEMVTQALESTNGFTLVLAELKVLLEQGRAMNLVRDQARLIESTR